VLELRERQARNLIALLLLSNGTPMLRAGDEFLHTQGEPKDQVVHNMSPPLARGSGLDVPGSARPPRRARESTHVVRVDPCKPVQRSGTLDAWVPGMRTRIWACVTAAMLTGCGASYLYSPAGAAYWMDGRPAAATDVPPEAPQGKVEVTSFGVVEMQIGGAMLPTLHVRAVITNDGNATPWTITPGDQLVEIAGEGRSAPLYVNTDVGSDPAIAVAQRERRVVDFYYPLPAGIGEDDDLPAFDFLWQVTTPARTYASRTHFQRLEREPPPTVHVIYGWGPHWWYDPMYPRVVFVHHRPIRVHPPGRVIIRDHRK
jgi:hypothetical protein